MKKVLFLQLKGNSWGGVWFVNKTIGEALIGKNYDVEIMAVRDSHSGVKVNHDTRLKVSTVNKKDIWEITHFSDVKDSVRKFQILKSLRIISKFIKDRIKLKNDFNYIKKYITISKFDYIVVTHYQLLDAIPKEYLKKTIHEQHTSFKASYDHPATRKAFDKYKNSGITFLWLTQATCDEAINHGYINSKYIYNPVRFSVDEKANVIENKKLITVTRISNEKRIDLMVKIVNNILKDKDFSDWCLEIYGMGKCKQDILNMDYDKGKIIFKGVTDDVSNAFLNSSINLNTSLFEGFSMGILEACECGVPTITFNFGESVSEEIINNKTGIFVDQNNIDEYTNRLKELMRDNKKLEKMSIECKKYAKKFNVTNIVKDWIVLFENLY